MGERATGYEGFSRTELDERVKAGSNDPDLLREWHSRIWRPCWLYTIEYITEGLVGPAVGVRIVEHKSETTALAEDRDSKGWIWRRDERVLDDDELRAWVLEGTWTAVAGVIHLAKQRLEIQRSSEPMP